MIFLKKKVQDIQTIRCQRKFGQKKSPQFAGFKIEYGSVIYQSELPEELSSLGRASFTRRGRPSIS